MSHTENWSNYAQVHHTQKEKQLFAVTNVMSKAIPHLPSKISKLLTNHLQEKDNARIAMRDSTHIYDIERTSRDKYMLRVRTPEYVQSYAREQFPWLVTAPFDAEGLLRPATQPELEDESEPIIIKKRYENKRNIAYNTRIW